MSVSGEVMNKVYEEFRVSTVEQIEKFKTVFTVRWGKGEIADEEYFLAIYQADHAILKGWHK